MGAPTRTLSTKLVRESTTWSGGSTSTTYALLIWEIIEWERFLFKSYNPSDFAQETTDDMVRTVTLDEFGAVVAVRISGTEYSLVNPSNP